MSYPNLLFVTNLNSLKDRRDKLSRSFIQKMSNPASCLHHLLPPCRDTSVTSRLRSCTPLPRPTSRTKKFQSFINLPSVSTNHLCNYNPSCIFVFLITDRLHLRTSVHLLTLLFYYYCCCTVCAALLFSYSAIFIAASVRNKLIHSYDLAIASPAS